MLLHKNKRLRSEIKNKLDSAKNKHFTKILNSSVNSKQLWSNLKNYGISAKPKPSPLTFFEPNNICNFFASISSSSQNVSENILIMDLNLMLDYPKFEVTKLSCNDIKQDISSIKSKAVGHDRISAHHLNLLDDLGLQLLTDIFNKSINDCIYP